MADDLLETLTRFHREVMVPDMERIVDDRISSSVGGLREEMLSHFDAVYARFDRLEQEFASLSATVDRSSSGLRLSNSVSPRSRSNCPETP